MADILPFTPAERAFDRDLRAERDRLHERYDPSPQQLRDARNYERIAEPTDYPVGVRFEEQKAIFSADELLFACFVSFVSGSFFAFGAAWLWVVLS